MTLNWDVKLNIGHELIDAQHKELIESFNEFVEACKASKGKENLNKTVDFLENYVATHFAAEERLMRNSDYPDIDSHLALHDEFRSKFLEMKTELNQTGTSTSLAIEMNEFLLRWFIIHIKGADAELGRYLGK
jgi:hemerythrin-like metal-binding protein